MAELTAEIFSTGTFQRTDGKPVTFGLEELDAAVRNWQALRHLVKVPLRAGHDGIGDGQPAWGWLSALRREGRKLIATFSQVPEKVLAAIKGGLYKRVSSGFHLAWERSSYSRNHPEVQARGPWLEHVAILGGTLPQVADLQDLDAFLKHDADDCDRMAATFEAEPDMFAAAVHAAVLAESGTMDTDTLLTSAELEQISPDERLYLSQGLNDYCTRAIRERATRRALEARLLAANVRENARLEAARRRNRD